MCRFIPRHFRGLNGRGPIEALYYGAFQPKMTGMVIRGRIEKRRLAFSEEQVSLPEGTEVTVWVRAASDEANGRWRQNGVAFWRSWTQSPCRPSKEPANR